MKRIIFLFFTCAQIISCQHETDLNKQKARSAPSWITNGIIYQIQPRAFTSEGTLNAATERLAHVADLGATIVYLCPVFVADNDADTLTWSPRQKSSKMNNAKNPYRMMDYYHVDSEYGTDDDLKAFVNECHKLGMKVMLDMVYLHCGSRAVFLKENPDFIKRDEEGTAIKAAWNWPALNYENDQLREYLWLNMEYWVTDFDVDGFRMDVAHGVPLDFWETARTRLEKIRPDVGMLAEASEDRRPEDQLKAFDANYSFVYFNALRDVFNGKYPISHLYDTWNKITKKWPKGSRFIRYFDNHDISNDDWHTRREKAWGFDACNAIFVHFFTLNGIPFIYNGQEIADTARHSIFGRAPIHWASAETLAGKKRFSFVQKLCELHKQEKALTLGKIVWLGNDHPESILSYMREFDGEQILTVINLTKHPQQVHIQGEAKKNKPFLTLISEDAEGNLQSGFELQEYGFWIGKSNLN